MGRFLLKRICACFILALITVSGKSLTSSCYGDVCGINNEHQFCSDKFQYCRNCEDVLDDCGTANQPTACNRYCIDIAVAKALNDKGSACSLVPIMLKIDNGVVAENSKHISFVDVLANLTYTCNEGYNLQGPSNVICTENGTWSHSSIPYCRENTCAADESKASKLCMPFITAGICVLALLGLVVLVCLCRRLRKRKGSMMRQNSENSLQIEKSHLLSVTQNEPDEGKIPTFPVRTERAKPADKRFDVDDTETQVPSPSSSTPPSKSDLKEKYETGGNNKTNCSDPEQKVPGGFTLVVKNEVLNILQTPGRNSASFQMQPETGEQCPRQNIDPLTPTSIKRENKDEKLPTEESRETEACVKRASGKNATGTKPLPSRNEELKPFQETPKEKKNKGPEAIPAEDDKFELSTDEAGQGQMTKTVGFQGVTFAKSEISDKHRNLLEQEDIDLAKNEQVASSQEMFEMKGVDDTETISENHLLT